jgi:hypothetical protein
MSALFVPSSYTTGVARINVWPGCLHLKSKPKYYAESNSSLSSFASSRPLKQLQTFASICFVGGVVLYQREKSRSQVSKAVLPDGTNEENEDLAQPLNMSRQDVRTVVLYQQPLSPPCVKIKTILSYYRVPFRTVAGRHPTSDYKKIPVLMVNKRQINDSHIIVKNLIHLLGGEPMTSDELAWERKITYNFQPAIEVELFSNEYDVARLWNRTSTFYGGWQRVVIGLLTPILGAFVGFLFRSRYPEMQLPSSTFGKSFREALKDKTFFHGDSPGPIDLCLYGTYREFTDCIVVSQFLEDSGLQDWHSEMSRWVR